MAKQKIYRVAAVEGRMINHPASILTGSVEMLGHEKYVDPKDPRFPFGEAVASRKFRHDPTKTELVGETADGFVRRKIMDGDLDYIETVDSFDAEEGSGKKERALVDVTEANRKKRETVNLDEDPTLSTPEKGGAAEAKAEEKKAALAFLKASAPAPLPDEDPNAHKPEAEKANPTVAREEHQPKPAKGSPKFP